MNAVKSANYTKVKVQELQRTFYLAAKANGKRRLHALYDKVCRPDVMWEAWKRIKANRGSAGIDGVTIQHIVQEYGEEPFVRETQQQLLENAYRPKPVQRKDIPKGDGKVNRGTYLIQAGDLVRHAYFCSEGLFRLFYSLYDGKEYNVAFTL